MTCSPLLFLIFGAILTKHFKVNYKKLNNLVGWLVFAIATTTYFMTIEPTTSFWDCGEYIATSVKLQVGHPPGAPFFQLMGNLFGQFASAPDQQALMVNALSALSSSFSILFLFWTITAMGAKLMGGHLSLEGSNMIAVLGAGAVGALAYTFSDSFWFSAVEGEVYAMSSFFTAAAFWAVLKWEQQLDVDPYANKWLLLIAYLVGLSVGVHILVFLTIPAIGMIYYFKKFPNPTRSGFIVANISSIAVLAIVFAFIIPLILKLFSTLEIAFVNTMNLPFHSGTITAFALLTVLTVVGLYLTKSQGKALWNQIIMGVVLIVLGYSTFIILAIRSNADTPIDENNPEDAMSLLAYYNREQYGDWPVLYGQSFNAPYDRTNMFSDGTPVYQRGYSVLNAREKQVQIFKRLSEAEAFVQENGGNMTIKGKYLLTDDKKASVPNYDPRYKTFFPRIWNDDPQYKQGYFALADIKDPKKPITFAQHFKFFVRYQVGMMYFRYFMWNFSGRQNDAQHRMELTKGNWITGIPFIDSWRVGNQAKLPDHFKNDPSRNTYFMLPFLLGIFGLYYQYKKNNKDAWAITLFFLMTGLAIVVYTNHKPFEPRERDYAFVGSFYAYAIWIGLGALGLYDFLKDKLSARISAIGVTVVTLVAVPLRMAAENWDDHDRSNRYTARDIAKAYLDSCAPNAILFTNGDNDTFPLWYVQEVEGYRTDVRIVNLSLLNTDWYIDQARRKAYDGEPVPFSFEWNQYVQGTRDVLYYQNPVEGRWDVKDFIAISKLDGDQYKFPAGGGKMLPMFQQKNLRINIDKEAVLANGVVAQADSARIVDYIDWDWKSNVITKRDLMVIDLIANNDWTRPIYFSITVGNNPKSFFWLTDYFRLEGMAYRFVPVQTPTNANTIEYGEVDTDRMYQNLVHEFSYGNMELPDVYLDETNRRLSYNLLNIFGRLSNALLEEGKEDKAVEVLDFAMAKMPPSKFGYNYFNFGIIEAYYRAGALEQARKITEDFAAQLDAELEFFASLKKDDKLRSSNEWKTDVQFYSMLGNMVQRFDREKAPEFIQRINEATVGLN